MSDNHNHTHYPVVQITLTGDMLKAPPGAIYRVMQEAQGVLPSTPMPAQTDDPWGTRLLWSEMPETYDSNEGGTHLRQYVSGMSMLCMRMRWGPYNDRPEQLGAPSIPFDHLTVHKAQDKVIIFVVKNGQPITLEDQKELFPSDELVTKMNLLTQDELPASPGLVMNARL